MLREFKLGAILGVCFLRQRVCACGEGQRSGDARWLVLGRELWFGELTERDGRGAAETETNCFGLGANHQALWKLHEHGSLPDRASHFCSTPCERHDTPPDAIVCITREAVRSRRPNLQSRHQCHHYRTLSTAIVLRGGMPLTTVVGPFSYYLVMCRVWVISSATVIPPYDTVPNHPSLFMQSIFFSYLILSSNSLLSDPSTAPTCRKAPRSPVGPWWKPPWTGWRLQNI